MTNDASRSGAETTPVPGRSDISAPSTAACSRLVVAWMTTTCANVASGAFSSDQVYLLFGMNKGWMVPANSLEVTLANRVIMSPTVVRGRVETLTCVLDTSRR